MVAGVRSPTNHISMTLHGSGFGLDELESAAAQLAGCRRAIQRFDLPALRRITWVEISKNRVRRVRDSLGGVFHDTNSVAVSGSTEESEIKEVGPFTTPMRFGNKPHIFVAMPFDTEFEDVFYYGIQKPAHESGFLCERVDQETFTGDILEHVKHKIDTASIVVAELTGQNANVYLEVGYAWGKGRRTVLLAKKQEKLLFDVRGQKILLYGTIKELDMILTRELTKLKEVYG